MHRASSTSGRCAGVRERSKRAFRDGTLYHDGIAEGKRTQKAESDRKLRRCYQQSLLPTVISFAVIQILSESAAECASFEQPKRPCSNSRKRRTRKGRPKSAERVVHVKRASTKLCVPLFLFGGLFQMHELQQRAAPLPRTNCARAFQGRISLQSLSIFFLRIFLSRSSRPIICSRSKPFWLKEKQTKELAAQRDTVAGSLAVDSNDPPTRVVLGFALPALASLNWPFSAIIAFLDIVGILSKSRSFIFRPSAQ